MTFLSNSDALILDLRRNGGGDPEAIRVLLSYFFDKRTHLNDIYFRDGNRTIESWTSAKVPGKKYLNKDVYVLTSKRTGSGGEECAYDLQCLHRATLIGTSTWGGANPGGVFRLTDHFSAFIPGGRAINPYTKKNWEGTGVTPDITVDADKALAVAQKMALEKLLAATTDNDDKDRYQQALKTLDGAK
jgi:C-terminal processing protease CtpA/Prc